jgi:hypothetical protein
MMERKRNADTDGVLPPAKRHNSSVNVEGLSGAVGGSSSAANKEIKFGAPESPFRYDLDVRLYPPINDEEMLMTIVGFSKRCAISELATGKVG